ncbi:MAG TPA: glycosyltransferase family 2 protein [Candidatus Limnocylindria bacterium]|nr:glycosyltransferase family 2 protein [Candidatus Limnocylindria bacterium]
MTVDVVIPVHGNWELTEHCLDTLPREAPIAKVIVVDDASPDDTAAQLARRGDVEIVTLGRNDGFAAACNAGAARSHADAIFFLNNDTIVPRGAIARLVAALEADTTIGAIGPRMLYPDGTIQSAGAALTSPLTSTRLYVHHDATIPQANVARDDLLLNGAALLIRRELFETIGGFDPIYRNGGEDADLCMQVWAHGYRCRYEGSVAIVHVEGASRGKQPGDDENRAIFAKRWKGVLHTFPRLAWQDPPAVALRWHARDGLDRLVRDRMLDVFKRFGGARRALVHTALDEALLRTLARLDGRATLAVSYGKDRGAVRIVAPRDARELASFAPRAGTRYWVPSFAARDALLARGAAADVVSVFRFGTTAEPSAPAYELREAVLMVGARTRADQRDAADVARALAGVPTRVVAYEDATADDLAAVRGASLVVVLDPDPWGLFVVEALGGGALILAPMTEPALEVLSQHAFVALRDGESCAEAAAAIRADFPAYAPRGARGAREAARRLHAVHAGERMRELARAAAHPIPGAEALAVTPAFAAELRDAAVR